MGARPCLKFMGSTVGLRELPSVTILNQIEVKLNELLVVLFGNPLVDAVESEKRIRTRNDFNVIGQRAAVKPSRPGVLLTSERHQA